ncbi:MAG: serine hydroxymethyltransferase [Candidatus Aenigmarchaeota archaeon]|nr:serine hydroxymethyltransferase [Candidatus Aenigmarchaeota archaeon]
MIENIKKTDPDIAKALAAELNRQRNVLELIPAENFVSLAVLEAMGSIATNKYSEGYPGKRYYGGNEHIDEIERIAISRARKLFGCDHANVQPLSGAPANIAVYFALLEQGDTILGMDLSHGGHLTHGHPVTHMSKIFKFVRYKMDKKTGLIDFDMVRNLAREHRPKLILAGYSAYPRDLDYKQFKEIADEVGAYTMADIAHIAGPVCTGLMNDPVPHFDVITTTTHKTLRGPRGAIIMCKQEFAEKIDKSVFPGFQGGPHEHQIAAKAVAFKEALQPEFKNYCRQMLSNAKTLAAALMDKDFSLITNGTDNHLMLVDLTNKNISGGHAEAALDKAGITVNKNMIPDDTRKPMDPSGIRLGTPAMTTRGLGHEEMIEIAGYISDIIGNDNPRVIEKTRNAIRELCSRFPLYPELKY